MTSPRVSDLVPMLTDRDRAGSWIPEPVRDASTVVLLVLDGLGWCDFDERRGLLPVLASLEGRPIATVLPSTTATALTSITTGRAPLEHGIVGYRIRIPGGIFNVLRWQYSTGRKAPDPRKFQPWAPFAGQDVPVVTRSEFRHSGFATAHLRVPRLAGWTTTSVLVEHVRRLALAGEPLIYAYYDGVDHVAHEYGLRTEFFIAELAAVDMLVASLLEILPARATLLVTADHGQVHVERDGHISLNPVAPLCEACAGEGRFRYLYTRRDAAKDLLAAAEESFGSLAWVLPRDRLIDEGWLGSGRPSREVRNRIGDVVLAAREPVAFLDPARKGEATILAHHGSLTDRESLVPLLAGRGRG